MSAPSVRQARFDLGRALADQEQRRAEAEKHLRRAFEEPGDVPGDWEIFQALGRLHRTRHAPVEALREFSQAILTAPPDKMGSAAREALDLLGSDEGAEAALRLGNELVPKLAELDLGPVSSPVSSLVPRLVARLALLTNDLTSVRKVVREHERQPDEELQAAALIATRVRSHPQGPGP